ncbi:MAG: hypothetical protein FJX54_03585 [Alphaproteobacteria bacterium]|nr:hypothetical protein [Alphaproteobacteria bacterium]
MASVSSVALVPVSAVYPRPGALKPVAAGATTEGATGFDVEALRRVGTFQAETLREAPRAPFEQPRPEAAETGTGRGGQGSGRRPAGDSAPFLAQLLAQDQPPQRQRDPFAEAARAYSRFQEQPRTGFVLEVPAKVDVRV